MSSAGEQVEEQAGPRPVAVAADATSVYVAEAAGDDPSAARQNAVERLDRRTLKLIASSRVTSPTDLVLSADDVWVGTSAGELIRLSASELAERGSIQTSGRGPAHVASSDAGIWIVNGRRDPPGYLLQLFDQQLKPISRLLAFEGGGTVHALTGEGSQVWLATLGAEAGSGVLRHVGPDGPDGDPIGIRAPAALANGNGRLWWASVDGTVGAIDEANLSYYSSMSVGQTASALAVSDGLIWVASADLVLMEPAK